MLAQPRISSALVRLVRVTPRTSNARPCGLAGIAGAVALALLVSACGPAVAPRPAAPSPAQKAADLRAAGAFAEAAEVYAERAAADAPAANLFRLRAADAWLDAGELPKAATAFDAAIDPSVTDAPAPDELAAYRLVGARLALARRDRALADDRLAGVSQADLPEDLKPSFWQVRARLAEANGNLADAILSRVEYEAALAASSPLRVPNAARLWTLLNRAGEAERALLSDHEDAQLTGWYELAEAVKLDIGDPEQLRTALDLFEQRYEGHPATLKLTDELVAESERLLERPSRIALILPLGSERLAGFARAVRDGFLAAYYGDREPGRPEWIRVYDAGEGQAAAAYTRAVGDGADFVVGPLTKANIQAMLSEVEFTHPALVLNQIAPERAARTAAGEMRPADLYQFGLPPEKEATTVAEDAWSFGYRRALTLAPIDPWGQRVVTAFSTRWTELGGEVLAEARFTDEGPAYSRAVAKVVGVEASRARAVALERLLGRNLEFVPRPRDDADFLFIAARPVEARQIVPQVRYFGADHIPLLATSHVFSGVDEARTDSDLEGVRFTEMPWLLGLADSPAGRSFDRVFEARYRDTKRLFALGVDAYHLSGRAARLKAVSDSGYAGLTGRLSVDRQGYVRREPAWGRFGAEGGAVPPRRPAGMTPMPSRL